MGPLSDHYAVLGVLPTSEDVVIRGAYLALIKKYHPDTFVGSRDYAERKSKEINAAYAVLSDPQRRKTYDELRSSRTQDPKRPRSETQDSGRREQSRYSSPSTNSGASRKQTFSETSPPANKGAATHWRSWWAVGLIGVALFAVRVETSEHRTSDPLTVDEASVTSDEFSALSNEENRRFLDDNALRPGVTVRRSGLQYRVIKSGSGISPTADDVVNVRYKGTLIDGTVFDETPPGKTATFPVGILIPGWIEALPLMKEGDEWEIVVPSELGYGAEGAGGVIPPDQTLVFNVALVRVRTQ